MNSNDEHQKNNEDQPWNQTFSEDRDENGNLSRVKLRKQSQNHHLITVVLAALIIIVAVVALVYGVVRQSAMGNDSKSAESSSVRVVRQDNAKKKSTSVAQAKSSSAKAKPAVKKDKPRAASKVSSTRPAASSSTSSVSTAQSNTAAQSTASHSTTNKTTATSGGHQYATVKAGQGMFRVAYNNGLTTEQLMQMNGLSANSKLYPGQRLRVR